MALKNDVKFKEIEEFKEVEEFGEFSPNHSKVQIFHSDGLLLSKVYEV